MRKIFLFIIGLTFLTGCTVANQQVSSSEFSDIKDKIELVKKNSKSAELRLVQNKITPKTYKLEIMIDNPEQKAILSARTWLAYNPNLLKVVKINTQDFDFDLAAPQENLDDSQEGLIKIGLSHTNEPISLTEIKVAEITVEKLQTGATLIDFYDYHEDDSGHTSVSVIQDGNIENILKNPSVPGLVIE